MNTSRWRAEEERIRIERIALARQRLVFMGQLAAGVAHEFRNPLHGVMQFVELAKRKVGDPKKIADYCAMMSEGLRRMDAISSRLLRLGSDTVDDRRMIDLREVVSTTASLASVLCERKGIRLSVGGVSEAPMVKVDAARLAEALLNLLQNSVDACSHGDSITVSLQRVNSDVELAVADTGPGIPKDIRSRLFEPFFTTKPLGKGTGLGLPIVQEVAIDHGGSIKLDETYATGTRFVLRLPAAQFATVSESP
jgi:two-component system, NtrC family, sensor kinase